MKIEFRGDEVICTFRQLLLALSKGASSACAGSTDTKSWRSTRVFPSMQNTELFRVYSIVSQYIVRYRTGETMVYSMEGCIFHSGSGKLVSRSGTNHFLGFSTALEDLRACVRNCSEVQVSFSHNVTPLNCPFVSLIYLLTVTY